MSDQASGGTTRLGRVDTVLARAQTRSIWWFVALAILVAFIPVSTPVTIGLYVFLVVVCWVPMARAMRQSFREGRADP